MIRLPGLAALALVLLAPSAALAKKVCVKDEAGFYWIFPSVKALKPGKAVSLNGVYLRLSAPVAGTAAMDFAGTVRIGVLVHSMAPFDPFGGNNATVTIEGDAAFNGTGFYDSDGNYVADAPAAWTGVDCAEALNPT